MPSVQRAHDTLGKNGIAVLTVSVDGTGEQAVKPFMAKHGYKVPVLIDQKMEVARSFGVRAVPFTIVVDRKGMIVAQGWGPFDIDSGDFLEYVRKLAVAK